ncbi:MAG: hypothetical protein ACRDD1_11695, partial [Planctomycetia bacterium]
MTNRTCEPIYRLLVPPGLLEDVRRHALAGAPLETCGLLAGVVSDGTAVARRFFPVENEAASPTEYAAGAALVGPFRSMGADGLTLV